MFEYNLQDSLRRWYSYVFPLAGLPTFYAKKLVAMLTRYLFMCTPFSVMASQAMFTYCEFNIASTACAQANPPISLIIVQHDMSTSSYPDQINVFLFCNSTHSGLALFSLHSYTYHSASPLLFLQRW